MGQEPPDPRVPALLAALLAAPAAPAAASACDKRPAHEGGLEAAGDAVRDLVRNDGPLGPVRSQGRTGLCFAYAASDLYETWLKRRGVLDGDERLSPLAMGLDYHEATLRRLSDLGYYRSFADGGLASEPFLPQGGWLGIVLPRTSRTCLESEVTSQGDRLPGLHSRMQRDFDGFPARPRDLAGLLKHLATFRHFGREDAFPATWEAARTVFKGAPFADTDGFRGFVESLEDDEDILTALLDASCQKRAWPKPRTRTVRRGPWLATTVVNPPFWSADALFRLIDRTLAEGNITAVDFKWRILERDGPPLLDIENHAATVVGSLSLCGEPHYIIRNSWGAKICGRMRRGSHAPWFCDKGGNFVISKEALAKGLTEVTIIED